MIDTCDWLNIFVKYYETFLLPYQSMINSSYRINNHTINVTYNLFFRLIFFHDFIALFFTNIMYINIHFYLNVSRKKLRNIRFLIFLLIKIEETVALNTVSVFLFIIVIIFCENIYN